MHFTYVGGGTDDDIWMGGKGGDEGETCSVGEA